MIGDSTIDPAHTVEQCQVANQGHSGDLMPQWQLWQSGIPQLGVDTGVGYDEDLDQVGQQALNPMRSDHQTAANLRLRRSIDPDRGTHFNIWKLAKTPLSRLQEKSQIKRALSPN